jgi:hypothetical protein
MTNVGKTNQIIWGVVIKLTVTKKAIEISAPDIE